MENQITKHGRYYFTTEKGVELYFRHATMEDAKLIFELSNENLVRENSINQGKIIWEDHLKWLPSKLNDGNCFYLLAFTKENLFVGQVRIDATNEDSIIGISISPEFRGKGLSSSLLLNSAKLFFDSFSYVNGITAKIVENNSPSIIAFTRTGYKYSHNELINNKVFSVFKLARENGN
jgi:RimJ/RimL family protein N-acetyltransferase